MSKTKLLFICTYNVSRSRTAEDLFVNSVEYEAKSAGFIYHSRGKKMVNQELVDWADKIIVMNESEMSDDRPPCRHASQLRTNFNLTGKEVFILGISDIYEKNDPRLVSLLGDRLRDIVGIIM